MSDKKLTQEQFDELERLFNNGDRTGYYLKYYEYTGNDQSLEMAQISSFSGILGGSAEMANRIIALHPNYPKEGVIKFSKEISLAISSAIRESFTKGKGGRLGNGKIDDITELFRVHKKSTEHYSIKECYQ